MNPTLRELYAAQAMNALLCAVFELPGDNDRPPARLFVKLSKWAFEMADLMVARQETATAVMDAETLDLMSEAAVEIENIEGPANPVAVRLRRRMRELVHADEAR